MTDRALDHAVVLFEQGRHDLAEAKLRQSLAADPDSAFAHMLLAHCLCARERWDEATAEAHEAIRCAPALPSGHAVLARALLGRNRFDEAEASVREAIQLDPEQPSHFALLARTFLGRRDWTRALAAAEAGLAFDPEDTDCLNLRATALVQLGRRAEAAATIAGALAREPDDPHTHANQGWACLHEGDRARALEHFREALRLDPDMKYARAGIVEAMKSKNFVYALLLRYFLWMGRLSRRAQWAIVLGGYLGYRVLSAVAANNPELAPWLRPLLVAYMVFAVLTWLASPLFNLLLRFDRFGRHALSRDQVVASNWVAGVLAPALVCLVAYFVTGNLLAAIGAGYLGLLLLPLSAVFNCDKGWPRVVMIMYTAALAALGPVAFLAAVVRLEGPMVLAIQAFAWGCVLSGLVANFLIMQTPRR
jgi:Tfp pilus assembly protein PilF